MNSDRKNITEILHKLEIRTIGELAKADPNLLELHLKSHGRTLWEFANGKSGDKVVRDHVENKGIGNSTTLPKDVTTASEAQKVFWKLAEKVAGRLRDEGQRAQMVSVEIKYYNFQSVSHQKQLTRATSNGQAIYEVACELFLELWNGEPVRLLGIRTSKLIEQDAPQQMNIFDYQLESGKNVNDAPAVNMSMKHEKHAKLDRAIDEIRKKFGNSVIKKGTND